MMQESGSPRSKSHGLLVSDRWTLHGRHQALRKGDMSPAPRYRCYESPAWVSTDVKFRPRAALRQPPQIITHSATTSNDGTIQAWGERGRGFKSPVPTGKQRKAGQRSAFLRSRRTRSSRGKGQLSARSAGSGAQTMSRSALYTRRRFGRRAPESRGRWRQDARDLSSLKNAG